MNGDWWAAVSWHGAVYLDGVFLVEVHCGVKKWAAKAELHFYSPLPLVDWLEWTPIIKGTIQTRQAHFSFCAMKFLSVRPPFILQMCPELIPVFWFSEGQKIFFTHVQPCNNSKINRWGSFLEAIYLQLQCKEWAFTPWRDLSFAIGSLQGLRWPSPKLCVHGGLGSIMKQDRNRMEVRPYICGIQMHTVSSQCNWTPEAFNRAWWGHNRTTELEK